MFISLSISLTLTLNPLLNRLEATIAGIRNADGFPIRIIGKYKIGISFGELILKSGPSGKLLGKSLHFLEPFIEGFVVTFEYKTENELCRLQ